MKSTLLLTLLVLLWMPVLNYGQARAFRDFIVAASSPTNPQASEEPPQENKNSTNTSGGGGT